MGLPWARLDANIATHDKILDLVGRRGGRSAGFCYVCSIGYSAGNGTDGLIPFAALGFIHATKKDAQLLVEVGLWEPDQHGWRVHNYGERQQLNVVSDAIRAGQRRGALKGNCTKWHEPGCKCWEAKQ